MEPPEGERDHRSHPVRVDFGVGFVAVVGTVEVFEGIELRRGFVETTQFCECEGVEGEVGEVVVGLVEERQGAGAGDLVDD